MTQARGGLGSQGTISALKSPELATDIGRDDKGGKLSCKQVAGNNTHCRKQNQGYDSDEDVSDDEPVAQAPHEALGECAVGYDQQHADEQQQSQAVGGSEAVNSDQSPGSQEHPECQAEAGQPRPREETVAVQGVLNGLERGLSHARRTAAL